MPEPVDQALSLEELYERVLIPFARELARLAATAFDKEVLDNYNECRILK